MRKVIDTYPTITLTIGTSGRAFEKRSMTREQAEEAMAEAVDSLNTVFKRDLDRQFDIDAVLTEETVCEHCGWRWTEASPDYNGGCCGKDEANSPERLADLQKLIDEVETADFYRWDADRGRDRVKIDWPWALACAADKWLKEGRSADGVEHLLSLCKRVKSSDWCTLWEDPGPSGCSLARLPDVVTRDIRPEQLADDLCSLIDDMDLLPARRVA